MKKSEIILGLLKIPVDFLFTLLAFVAAYKLRILYPYDANVLPQFSEYLNFSLIFSAILVIVFAFGRMYTLKNTTSFFNEGKKIIINCGIWMMIIVTYFFAVRILPFSRSVILMSWIFANIFLLLGRILIYQIQKLSLLKGYGVRKLILVGDFASGLKIMPHLATNPSYQVLGIITNEDSEKLKKIKAEHKKNYKNNKSENLKELNETLKSLKILGKIKETEAVINKFKPDEILQTKSHFPGHQDENILEICDYNHVHYSFVPDLLDVRRTKNIEIQNIKEIPIIGLKSTPLDGWGKVTKRIADIFGASLGLIILSPIFLITAIAIKIDSPGPVIFNTLDDGSPAKRVGKQGKLFRFHKFRSMVQNSHMQRYKELAEKDIRKDGPLVKIENDPRVTKVGKFIRRFDIDELPNLWSVLIGDMSLVGPRPHLPEEVAKYKKHHRFVLTIKPGITGLAQISGRSDLNFDDEVRLDRYYIENWTLWKDIKIIFKTVGVIFGKHRE